MADPREQLYNNMERILQRTRRFLGVSLSKDVFLIHQSDLREQDQIIIYDYKCMYRRKEVPLINKTPLAFYELLKEAGLTPKEPFDHRLESYLVRFSIIEKRDMRKRLREIEPRFSEAIEKRLIDRPKGNEVNLMEMYSDILDKLELDESPATKKRKKMKEQLNIEQQNLDILKNECKELHLEAKGYFDTISAYLKDIKDRDRPMDELKRRKMTMDADVGTKLVDFMETFKTKMDALEKATGTVEGIESCLK